MNLEIYTPNKVLAKDDNVTAIIMPAHWGQICVLPGHTDFITTLHKGQIIVRKETKEEVYEIESGFFEIKKNKATILMNEI